MDDIDIKKLERCYIQADADLRALRDIISRLELENNHLRQVIELLITSKSPTL